MRSSYQCYGIKGDNQRKIGFEWLVGEGEFHNGCIIRAVEGKKLKKYCSTEIEVVLAAAQTSLIRYDLTLLG